MWLCRLLTVVLGCILIGYSLLWVTQKDIVMFDAYLACACNVGLVAVDSDGHIMKYVPIAESCGVQGFFPCEVKSGNDLFTLRKSHPHLVLFGWLEKEVINEGNGDRIEDEIMSKVRPLLSQGGYFPNADHSLQPLATFDNLCRFMTILHDVCGNSDGTFSRM